MTAYILSFRDIDSSSLPLVGGKGANLGEMTKAGFPVPDGFCVTTTAYHAFTRNSRDTIRALLDGLNPTDLEGLRIAGQSVRALLNQRPLPDDVAHAILAELRATGPDIAYAFRSSATAEDLPTASFAGQQDTYLNVIGAEALLDSIRQCFVSLYTDRAILYRLQNDFPHHKAALSVVVQRMVMPEVSGILFTADPITEHRGICSVDASFGLGEALVSGVVSADLYKIDKENGKILSKEIADKRLAILPLKEGGTKTMELPGAQRKQPALSHTQIRALAQIGKRIEAHYGAPQDIEWAIDDGEIFITQSRPITSLYPQPENSRGDDALHVYVSLSHLQVMTDPMPPLSISIWKQLPTISKDENGDFPYLYGVGGRLYIDLSPMLRHPIGRKIIATFLGVADQIMHAAVMEVAAWPEFRAEGERFNPLAMLTILFPLLFRVPVNLFFKGTENAVDRANQISASYLADVQAELTALEKPLIEKLNLAIKRLRGFFHIAKKWLPQYAAGAIAQRLLPRIVGEENVGRLTDLERGLVGNAVTEMNLTIGDLADLGRSSTSLRKTLSDQTMLPDQRLSAATKAEGGTAFLGAWRSFLDRYGARGPSEIDASRPSWNEDPASLLQMIMGMMAQTQPGAHRLHFNDLVAKGKEAAASLPARVHAFKRPLVRRLTRVARNLAPLREHHKFLMIQLLAEGKTVLIDIGNELAHQGTIAAPDDVWMLTVPELRTALSSSSDLECLVELRRIAFLQDAERTPPRLMTSQGEIIRPKLSIEGAPDGALIGSPVSAGIFEGTARVVLDPTTETLEPGSILVAPFTDPGWTPLFVNAGGLVTEVGGLMTHGSVVARKYGIPAVVGVIEATKLIKTGDRIRINGDSGYVEILERSAS